MYNDILCCLRDAVRRKHQEKWGTNSWFLLHYNAPEYWSVLIKDFLAKNNVKTLEHPTYSPDLAPADFYLFPQMKSAMTGCNFCDANDIIRNGRAEKVLTKLLPGMFTAYLLSLALGFSISEKQSDSRNILKPPRVLEPNRETMKALFHLRQLHRFCQQSTIPQCRQKHRYFMTVSQHPSGLSKLNYKNNFTSLTHSFTNQVH